VGTKKGWGRRTVQEMTDTSLGKRRAVRTGRPPRELAGEVETRILDAARSIFLKRGLAGASIDEIAELASAGKPTIYARYANKEAIFTAVVMQTVAAAVARYEDHRSTGATIEERLESVGITVLNWIMAGDTIRLMQVAIAEAHRLPDLASSVHRMARERAIQAVSRLIAEAAQSDELRNLSAFAPENLMPTTRQFQEVVVLPLLIRALFGEKLEELREEIAPQVKRGVAFFLAGCRNEVVPGLNK
jgi:AcrR family transcriptional regulator